MAFDGPPPLVERPLSPLEGWGPSIGNGWQHGAGAAAPAMGGWGGAGGMAMGGGIPPPPGATFMGAGTPGAFGGGQSSAWAEQNNYHSGKRPHIDIVVLLLIAVHTRLDYNTSPNGFPLSNTHLASNSAMPLNSWQYQPPTSSFAPQSTPFAPSGFDASHFAALRQQTMSAPPEPSYSAPSWSSMMATSPYGQKVSAYEPMAQMSLGSSMAVTRPQTPFTYSPASTLGSSPGGMPYGGLPDRPSEWRKDFTVRSGISSLLPRSRNNRASYPAGMFSVSLAFAFLTAFVSLLESGNHSHVIIHPFIQYNHSDPPVTYDLRHAPRTLMFRDVPRHVIASDLARYTCEPPVPYMRIYHPRLPWYIDAYASNPTGVNLGDLFTAIYNSLQKQIQHADFYNDELEDDDRNRINWAYKVRCMEDRRELMNGVRRVDYLRRSVLFEGLVKGKNGMWEMRTRKGAYTN